MTKPEGYFSLAEKFHKIQFIAKIRAFLKNK